METKKKLEASQQSAYPKEALQKGSPTSGYFRTA